MWHERMCTLTNEKMALAVVGSTTMIDCVPMHEVVQVIEHMPAGKLLNPKP
jgi:hypothetical protein